MSAKPALFGRGRDQGGSRNTRGDRTRTARMRKACVLLVAGFALYVGQANADEGGVSFWLPGLFGSLAAVPQQPGFSLATIDYHTTVSAGGDVALAREFAARRIPLNLSATLSARLDASADLVAAVPTYTFATPVFGGQAAVGLMGIFGRNTAAVNGALTGTLATPFGTIPFSRFDSIADEVTGFGDLYPQALLRWNTGVNNFMAYITGDIPVGDYDPTRLSNIGLGHGAIDGGFGSTYLDPTKGHEFSVVGGFTYNFTNPDTQYKNGVDFHLDWGASQFLNKQLLVGLVGYVYDQLGCDSGTGDRVGCFESRVFGVGPQVGFIVPMGQWQGYFNVKGYGEFDARNRPDGFNVWLTFAISPAAAPPPVMQTSQLVHK
jgi:hypothetical protein